MTLLILFVIAVALFTLAYMTKRRFGVLGLALAAGLVLSNQLATEFATFLRLGDFPVEPLSHKSAAIVFLILAPALVLLFSGPKYTDKRAAIAGSVTFAVFGTVLLLAPLTMSLPLTDVSMMPLMSQIAQNSPTIIATALIVAVVDTMLAHSKKPLDKKARH